MNVYSYKLKNWFKYLKYMASIFFFYFVNVDIIYSIPKLDILAAHARCSA